MLSLEKLALFYCWYLSSIVIKKCTSKVQNDSVIIYLLVKANLDQRVFCLFGSPLTMVKPQIYPPLDKIITQTASELHLSAVYFCRPNCAAHLCILFQLYPPFFPSFPTLLSHSSSIGSHKTGGSPLHLVGDTDLPPTTASSTRLAVIPL